MFSFEVKFQICVRNQNVIIFDVNLFSLLLQKQWKLSVVKHIDIFLDNQNFEIHVGENFTTIKPAGF